MNRLRHIGTSTGSGRLPGPRLNYCSRPATSACAPHRRTGAGWPDVRQRRPQQTSRRKNRTPSAGALGVGVCCLTRLSSLSGRGRRGGREPAQLNLDLELRAAPAKTQSTLRLSALSVGIGLMRTAPRRMYAGRGPTLVKYLFLGRRSLATTPNGVQVTIRTQVRI